VATSRPRLQATPLDAADGSSDGGERGVRHNSPHPSASGGMRPAWYRADLVIPPL
jgi:hypothetical protein